MFDDYLKDVFKSAKSGDATEPTYYPYLKDLLKAISPVFGKTNIRVEQLPKRTEGGCPDLVVKEGEQHIVGYIEAKDVGADLTPSRMSKQNKAQFKRYLETFPNLIYTNFTEFRLYRDHNAKPMLISSLCEPPEDLGFKVPGGIDADGKTKDLLDHFFDFSLAKKYTAKTLAQELAKRTRFLKDEVAYEQKEESEREEEEDKTNQAKSQKIILSFYNAFRNTLIKTLTEEDFADLFAQTIAFGLFAARYRTTDDFSREVAYAKIPPTIGVLRNLFEHISKGQLPQLLNQVVDDISEVLSVVDVHNILDEYYKSGKGRDPIFYFYETFLAEYNPQEKEQRGVFYTPEPVVGYIVRSVHKILQDRFKREEGLGCYLAKKGTEDDPRTVMVLDPAGGTLTFIAEATVVGLDEYVSIHGDGDKQSFFKNHVLQNFYAFEFMMAPYVLGHLKMSFLLEEKGYELGKDERFKFYLTNTLSMDRDEIVDEQMKIWKEVLPAFVAEYDAAYKVKKETPILVVIGNPPYSGISKNPSEEEVIVKAGEPYVSGYDIEPNGNGGYKAKRIEKRPKKTCKKTQKTWIGELIEDYKIIDGAWFGEKKHWLNDDYVKFMRFAQWKIDQKGEGILGFITNHAYLDNPTFRGMRQSLMNSFNEIRILDLHGNANRKERCPDGTEDRNVFDIRQGVAIGLFVKTANANECDVYHHELWGLRESDNPDDPKTKYGWLRTHDVSNTPWNKLSPISPRYYFRPFDSAGAALYDTFWPIPSIFPVNQNGILTARNSLTIKWSSKDVWKTVTEFVKLDSEKARSVFNLPDDGRNWQIETAQTDLRNSGPSKDKIVSILCRPFDIRSTYYTGTTGGVHVLAAF